MSKIWTVVAGVTLMGTAVSANANIALCKGCHGQEFEKKAMGKSKVVKDMSKKAIIKALKGYKAGTYGRVMKQTMEDQVKKLSEKDIEAIAKKIKK